MTDGHRERASGVIVGAGCIGASIAYHLAGKGVRGFVVPTAGNAMVFSPRSEASRSECIVEPCKVSAVVLLPACMLAA